MADQMPDRRGTATTISDLFRRGFNTAREEIARRRKMTEVATANQVARKKNDRVSFEAANGYAQILLRDLLSDYSPEVTQAEINRVTWEVPNLIAELLEREVYRIHDTLRPFMKQAGYPLDTDDRLLDKEMDKVWAEAHAAFHEKAFAHLDLPRYFCFRDGILGYEPIRWRKQHLYQGYVGLQSGYRYPSKRVLGSVLP